MCSVRGLFCMLCLWDEMHEHCPFMLFPGLPAIFGCLSIEETRRCNADVTCDAMWHHARCGHADATILVSVVTNAQPRCPHRPQGRQDRTRHTNHLSCVEAQSATHVSCVPICLPELFTRDHGRFGLLTAPITIIPTVAGTAQMWQKSASHIPSEAPWCSVT